MPTTKNQFTPGKWEASGDSIICGNICIAVIETDGGYEAPSEQREANKALLVSAPALFAALQDCLTERTELVETAPYAQKSLTEKIRAALALAQKEAV